MIKREHIKQAIDAISRRDPNIGYSLDEMLGMGMIDVPFRPDAASQRDDFYFLFENEEVPVNKFLYLNEGTAAIEQGLLIKYGELVKKQEILDKGDTSDYQEAAREIRGEGLNVMVTHEIDYAIARLRKRPGMLETNTHLSDEEHPGTESSPPNETLISFLEKIKKDDQGLGIARKENDPAVLYRGIVDDGTPAYFIRFPFCMDALMQVADMNVEFFHVRFILNCLARGLERNLFACVVDRRIVGLIYLTFKERIFYKGMEIKFMATLRGKTGDQTEPAPLPLKGIGTFLVAGVWILWKNELQGIKEIILDSEIGARRFYESAGFEPRGLAAYVLRHPKGHLMKAILIMAKNCQDLMPSVIEEIEGVIMEQIRALRKKAGSEKKESARKVVIDSIKECLKSGMHPEFGKTAVNTLMKYKKRIPESKELIQFALKYASDEVKGHIEHASGTCH